MDGAQGLQRHSLSVKDFPNLHYVLVKGTAANVSMETPDRVDEIFARDNRIGIRVEVVQDTEFLAAYFSRVAVLEIDRDGVRVDLRSGEREWVVHHSNVLCDIVVTR